MVVIEHYDLGKLGCEGDIVRGWSTVHYLGIDGCKWGDWADA